MTKGHRRRWSVFVLGLLGVVFLTTLVCYPDTECGMTYEEAITKMVHLAHKIDQVAEKTSRSILKANHWHQMEKQAEMADKSVARIIRNASKLIEEAAQQGITFTTFDVEVFNEAVGRWIAFDPIHILSSGD